MPLFHVHGLIGATISTLVSDGTLVIPRKFSASSFWGLMNEFECTWYTAVPTIHKIIEKNLQNKKIDCPTLRFARSCSSALSDDLFVSLENLLSVPVIQVYFLSVCNNEFNLPII